MGNAYSAMPSKLTVTEPQKGGTMENSSYQEKRDRLEEYFDRTAADQWAKLTSDAPVSGIQRTYQEIEDLMYPERAEARRAQTVI